jgi:hypothetical protein
MANKIWVGTDAGNEGKWGTAANWSPSGVPITADDVFLKDSAQNVTGDFDQSAVLLASYNQDQSYTGLIGDAINYLIIGATKVNIGYHDGPGSPAGSGRTKLDLRDDLLSVSTVIISNTGTPIDTNKPAVRLLANKNTTTIEVKKGSVGIAYEVGETSSVSSITIGYISQVAGDADVFIGSGLTLITLNQNGGDCLLKCGATTVNANAGGTLQTEGAGAIATLNAKGGKTICNSTGTITALNISEQGDVDFTKSSQARTVTTPKLDKSGKLKYDPAVVTFTNKIASNNAIALQAA